MKILALSLIFAIVPGAACMAQGTALVYDSQVQSSINNGFNNISGLMGNLIGRVGDVNNSVNSLGGKLDAQLRAIDKMASDQLEQLQKMVKALEDTAEDIHETVGALGKPKDEKPGQYGDMIRSVNDLRNSNEFNVTSSHYDKITSPTDPTKAFTAKGDDLLPSSIGSKFTYHNPDTKKDEQIDRNKDLYRMPVVALSAVNDYYTVREIALKRRKALQSLLTDTLDDLKNATNFAQVAKLSPLVQVIEGQIQSCNHDINTAYNDLAARGLQMYALNSIKTTAEMEPQTYQTQKKNDDTQKKLDDFNANKGKPLPDLGNGSVSLGSNNSYFPWYSR